LRAALPKVVAACDQLTPVPTFGHYLSLSTPHLGVQASWSAPLHWWRNLCRLTSPVSSQLVQIAAQDTRNGRVPFLVELANADGPYIRAFRRFRVRTCATAIGGDPLVPVCSGLICDENPWGNPIAAPFSPIRWRFEERAGVPPESAFETRWWRMQHELVSASKKKTRSFSSSVSFLSRRKKSDVGASVSSLPESPAIPGDSAEVGAVQECEDWMGAKDSIDPGPDDVAIPGGVACVETESSGDPPPVPCERRVVVGSRGGTMSESTHCCFSAVAMMCDRTDHGGPRKLHRLSLGSLKCEPVGDTSEVQDFEEEDEGGQQPLQTFDDSAPSEASVLWREKWSAPPNVPKADGPLNLAAFDLSLQSRALAKGRGLNSGTMTTVSESEQDGKLVWKTSNDNHLHYPVKALEGLHSLSWQRIAVSVMHFPASVHVFLIAKQKEQFAAEHTMALQCVECMAEVLAD